MSCLLLWNSAVILIYLFENCTMHNAHKQMLILIRCTYLVNKISAVVGNLLWCIRLMSSVYTVHAQNMIWFNTKSIHIRLNTKFDSTSRYALWRKICWHICGYGWVYAMFYVHETLKRWWWCLNVAVVIHFS